MTTPEEDILVLLSSFATQGFCGPLVAVDPIKAAAYRQQFERFEASLPGGKLQGKWRFQSHLLLPWVSELVREPRILDAVQKILGEDLLVWFTEFHVKEPQSPGYYSWHQDSTYAGLDPPQDVVTVWVALSPSTQENGCLHFVPGSHDRQLPHKERPEPSNLLLKGQYIDGADLDVSTARGIDLSPGQFTIHAFRCAHASGPNKSATERRIGLAIRYMKPNVRQTAKLREGAVLVRGRDHYQHFDHRESPTHDMSPQALELHDLEMKIMSNNYMQMEEEEQTNR